MSGVEQPVDALAGGQLAARAVLARAPSRRRPRATSAVRSRSSATSSSMRVAARRRRRPSALDLRGQHRHAGEPTARRL